MLQVEDAALDLRLLANAAEFLWLGLWVGGAAALAGMIGEIAAGRPFSVKVSRGVAVLIGIAAIGLFVPSAVDNIASLVLMTGVGIEPTHSVFGLRILELNIVALLAVFVLASQDQAIRFSTMTAICDALDCRPGGLFSAHLDPDQPLDR